MINNKDRDSQNPNKIVPANAGTILFGLIVPAGDYHRINPHFGARYFADCFDLCQLAAGQAE